MEYRPPRRVVIFAGAKWIGITPTLNLAIWSLQPTDSSVRVRLEHPKFLYTIQEPGIDGHVGRWALGGLH